LFTSTRRIVVGPDTTISLLAGSIVIPLAAGDPSRAADLAALLALMTGTLLIVAGRIGFGDVADLLSTPVLIGYATGAALLLIGTQLPVLFGVTVARDAFFLRVVDVAVASPGANVATTCLGLGLIALLLLLGKSAPRAPAALIACVAAIAASRALDTSVSTSQPSCGHVANPTFAPGAIGRSDLTTRAAASSIVATVTRAKATSPIRTGL